MKAQDDYGLFGNDSRGNKNFDDMDENIHKDYSSVEKMVKLPNMRQIKHEENVFPPVEQQLINSTNISEDLKQTFISLREGLNKEFKTFEDPKKFRFTFPQSLFPPVEPGKRNLISYEQKNIVEDEDTFRDKLSAEQIAQIAQNGEFKVESNHQYITLPYVWKVNGSLFRGKKNIVLSWWKGIANAHSYLSWAKKLYSIEIPNELRKISKLPMRLFSLFFGKRSMRSTASIDYNREIAKDFWNEVMDKYYVRSQEWGSILFEYLDNQYKAEDYMTIQCDDLSNKQKKRQYEQKQKQQQKSRDKYNSRVEQNNKKKEKIMLIGDDFERRWTKSKKKVFQQVSREYQQEQTSKKKEQTLQIELGGGSEDKLIVGNKQNIEEENLLQRLNEKKFTLYTQFLQKKLPQISVPNNVISSLVSLLTIMQIITQKQRKLSSTLNKEKARVQNEIKQQHKILQHDYRWYYQQVDKRYRPIEQRINREYYSKFVTDDVKLAQKLSDKQKQTYTLWLQYRAKYDSYLQAKRKQYPEIQQPTRTFYSTYQLLPPYKVITHKEQNNGKQWYQMVKIKHMQISTDKNFWKVHLYLMRVKSWTINCVVFLIYCCWKGTFGLRCLWGVNEFTYNMNISRYSGEITYNMRKPVLTVFMTVLEGVKKSRQHFQSLPDRGLFGKNFSRYFNYAECYVFRLLIVGVVLTLIVYPIAIVIQSVVMFVLILTVWVWMPVVLLVTYLFNTIFFQFESGYIPYGFFIRAAPLLSLMLSLLKSLMFIVWILLFTIVISPVIGLLIVTWTLACRIFRTITDFLMLFFIRKLGRTPSRNTAIAKKISGPGMSKQYYMSINQQDVYILIQSQLQQIFMREFNRIYMQQINKPVNRFNDVMKLLLAPFMQNQYYNQCNNLLINGNVNQLRNLYSKYYQEYMNRYPNRPWNIRFTQEEIDSYFENTIKIVQNFVHKKNISSWIFDQNHVLQGDYEQLTRKLWMTVFNCGQEIFEPLEKIDQRFKLEDMYKDTYDYDESSTSYSSKKYSGGSMKKNVGKVMQALEGEVQLKPRRAKIEVYKHSLLHRELNSIGVREVIRNINDNSDNSVYFSTSQTKFIFYPNLAIKQVTKKDTHQYELKKKKQNANNY